MSKNILIIGPSWVGDMVMSQSLYRLLKANDPNVNIDVLAPEWTEALLTRMPEVRRAISMPLKHGDIGLKSRYLLGKKLRSNNYQQAIVLPNSFKSALIPFFAHIPKRTGWKGEWRYGLLNDIRVLNKEKYPLMIERFMALGLDKEMPLSKPYPYPQFSVTETNVNEALQQLNIARPTKPVLALCPGAQYGPSKRWPARYFAEVANEKLSQGWDVWLFGAGQSDLQIAEEIQQGTENRCLNLVGKTDLGQAIDLLSLVSVVVTNDSGLMHIAAPLNVPLIAIYGSSSPSFTPPLSEKANVLSLHLPCSPCFKRECPLKHWRCMLELKPEMVLEAIKNL